MSKRLLRWFGDYRNKIVLDMVRDHLQLTMSAVQALYSLVSVAGVDPFKKNDLYRKVSDFEMRADELRREMIVKLTERDVFPTEREDLMELVRAVDWVADWSREAGRLLIIIPFEETPNDMKQTSKDISKALIRSVEALSEAINLLSQDALAALEMADQVEMLEEDIDELYGQFRMQMSTMKFPGFSRGSLILLNEFFDAMETVADWCENTADIVRAIAVRTQ
ncbi:MAG: DUF47 family protein [Candidatus Bathyarchaeota archaeon]|jgi:hypothetical protein